MKRAETVRVMRDCMTVSSSEEEVWEYRSDGTDQTCGLYLVTNPDMLIEVEIIQLDVDCDNGLLVVEILISALFNILEYFKIFSLLSYLTAGS